MKQDKKAEFNIIFQGAGEGQCDDISFQFMGATLSDAMFSLEESSGEFSAGNGGRYDHYDLENAAFYPTKEFLEEQTQRIFGGTAPDSVNFSLVSFPGRYWWTTTSQYSQDGWRSYWYTEYSDNSPSLGSNEEIVGQFTDSLGTVYYTIRAWYDLKVYMRSSSSGKGLATFKRANDGGYWDFYLDFDKMLLDFFTEDQAPPPATVADVMFSSAPDLLHYESFLPYPYEKEQHYAIERDTGTAKSLMAVYWGDAKEPIRQIGLTPAFAFEQSLVALGIPKRDDLRYNDRYGDLYAWKDYASNAETFTLGFAEDIPGAELKTQEIGSDIELFYWDGCSGASTVGLMNTNSELWSGRAAAVMRTVGDKQFYYPYYSSTLTQKSELSFSYNSGNNDEGKYDIANINYMFIFRSDGTVCYAAELPGTLSVPQGCSFELTAEIKQEPFVWVI